jgi:hypothetical protein
MEPTAAVSKSSTLYDGHYSWNNHPCQGKKLLAFIINNILN